MSDSDNLAEAANRLSLAAVLLGGSAFIISFLQAVLQYVTSSEERNKCNSSAIDISEKHKRWSFSPLHWKTKFYYPELSLKLEDIKSQMLLDSAGGLESCSAYKELKELKKEKKEIFVDLVDHSDTTTKDIQDGTYVLKKRDSENERKRKEELRKEREIEKEGIEEEEDDKEEEEDVDYFVTTGDLTWLLYLKWRWWIFWHPPLPIRRPRASWAQLLRAFRLRDTKELFRRHVDASAIPRDLDVPIQRIRLFELGKIAMFLGFTEVEIKIKERQFTATGPFAAITTVDLEYFGKVLRFEGDPFVIASKLPLSDFYFSDDSFRTFIGELPLGPYHTARSMVPLEVHLDLLEHIEKQKKRNKIEDKWVRKHVVNGDTAGNLTEEASCFEQIWSKDLWSARPQSQGNYTPGSGVDNQPKCPIDGKLKIAIRYWQEKNRLIIPTIFTLGCFAGTPSVVNGYPGNVLIHPFMAPARIIAKELVHGGSKSFTESKLLQEQLTYGKIGHVRELSTMNMSKRDIGMSDGSVCWGFSPLEQIFDALPSDLQHVMVGSKDDKPAKLNFESLMRNPERNAAINADDITVLIMPGAHQLLANFHPREWVAALNLRDVSTLVMSWTPEAFIWCQLTVIDLSIYLMILGCYYDAELRIEDYEPLSARKTRGTSEKWEKHELKILESIIKSHKLDTETEKIDITKLEEPYEWDLLAALKKHSGLPTQGDQAERRLTKLSDALKLRCLFYIAFLMINPDSTDVFLARHSEVEMPMI